MPACEDLASAAFVEVDPERLGMMVEHLIRNAQEATAEDGEVHVSVTISRNVSMDPVGTSGIYPALTTIPPTDRRSRLPSSGPEGRLDGLAGDFACLTVEDTGSGMSPEFIKERLFKPFDTTKGSKGMGIGAYQVREYVRTVGGRVIVQSTPGEGTRFTLWLPLQSAPEAAAQP
jgi:signal transduction histidine kinase